MRKCIICGGEIFKSQYKVGRPTCTCSKECRRLHKLKRRRDNYYIIRRKEKKCIICGTKFIGIKTSKCCSKICKRKYATFKRNPRVKRICKVCHKNYIGTRKQQYCNKKCRYIGIRVLNMNNRTKKGFSIELENYLKRNPNALN